MICIVLIIALSIAQLSCALICGQHCVVEKPDFRYLQCVLYDGKIFPDARMKDCPKTIYFVQLYTQCVVIDDRKMRQYFPAAETINWASGNDCDCVRTQYKIANRHRCVSTTISPTTTSTVTAAVVTTLATTTTTKRRRRTTTVTSEELSTTTTTTTTGTPILTATITTIIDSSTTGNHTVDEATFWRFMQNPYITVIGYGTIGLIVLVAISVSVYKCVRRRQNNRPWLRQLMSDSNISSVYYENNLSDDIYFMNTDHNIYRRPSVASGDTELTEMPHTSTRSTGSFRAKPNILPSQMETTHIGKRGKK